MARIVLPKASLVSFNGNALTEHNRQPLTVTPDQIENKQRMADGTMRKYFIAAKRVYQISYENVPGTASKTVDGKWGANDINSFYYNTPGPFTMLLKYANGNTETVTVMFSSFECDLQNRGYDDNYNVTIGVEEV